MTQQTAKSLHLKPQLSQKKEKQNLCPCRSTYACSITQSLSTVPEYHFCEDTVWKSLVVWPKGLNEACLSAEGLPRHRHLQLMCSLDPVPPEGAGPTQKVGSFPQDTGSLTFKEGRDRKDYIGHY